VALGEAARLARPALLAAGRLRALRDLLAARLEEALPGRVHLNGHPEHRLPNTLNVTIEGAGEVLALVPGVAASAGSACHEGSAAPSPVLAAMNAPAGSALRLTLGRTTTEADVETAARLLIAAVGHAVRDEAPAPPG
jgi:cysteine desulfurase